MFRIARSFMEQFSRPALLLTKPITSAAIFGLIEIAQLQPTDKVFGPSGVLRTKCGKKAYRQSYAPLSSSSRLPGQPTARIPTI
ncbi:MAG: hypothetical protein ABSE86_20510 [Bryobacteraceae bacterium]